MPPPRPRFIADAYHALADNGHLDNTVFIVTYDEWGGFYDHVPPPRVIDNTDPSTVDHTGDSTTPTDGQLIPDYRQLGFRVPTIVVSNLAPARVVHHGPFEHTSTLKLIETTFGLTPLAARDAHAENLGRVLERKPRRPVRPGTIPTSGEVPGPANDVAAICNANSVQSVSPRPNHRGKPLTHAAKPLVPRTPGAGMAAFGRTRLHDESK